MVASAPDYCGDQQAALALVQQIGPVIGPAARAYGKPVLRRDSVGVINQPGQVVRPFIEDFLLVGLLFQQGVSMS